MEDGHYVRNADEGAYKGPFEDLIDAMEAGKIWKEDGDEVTIHMVEDGDIVGSWEYSEEGLIGIRDFEGQTFQNAIVDYDLVSA